ncbi:MAG: hypothetical protein II360_03490 [Muribaculaceae bacterium]|nr:hypothetical protein [Muribaculaceae bacterium]
MKRELLSLLSILTMLIFTVITFASNGATSQAVSSLVLTVVSIFVYALITLLQDKPDLYNMPYEIAEDNRQHANRLMSDSIIKIKTLTMLLLTAFTVLARYSCPTITITLTAIYIVMLTIFTITTFNKLKRLR